MIEVVKDLKGELAIPNNFSRTVQAYNPNKPQRYANPRCHSNPQTTELCALLGLTDLCAKAAQLSEQEGEEQWEDEHSVESADEPSEYPSENSGMSRSINPDEIIIEDEWDEEPGEQEIKELEGVPEAQTAGEVQTPRPMVLPKPKLDVTPSNLSLLMELDPHCHSTPTIAQSHQCDDEDEDEDSAAITRMLKRTSEEAGDSGGRGIPPRIKRRNQVIYSVPDGEDDETESGGGTAPVS